MNPPDCRLRLRRGFAPATLSSRKRTRMLQLHDNTRRRICLVAFLGLCVVPAVIVLACGVARHLPGHVRDEAERLARQLGQEVSVERVRHPRPGVVVYDGLELSDSETGRRILRCRTLEARWETSADASGDGRKTLVLFASQPEIEADRLEPLWQLVLGMLTRRTSCPESDVRFETRQLRFRRGETRQTLTELEGRIERLSGESRADVAFRLAEVETPEPIRLRIARNHQIEPPSTGVGLHTGGGALPCSLLALGVPELETLGPQSRFRGYLWVNETPEGCDGELTGEFIGVDIEGLVARYSPHTLRGTAQLTVRLARFQRGRLWEATGSVSAGPGFVSRSLLDAAADRLGMTRGLEASASDDLISYEQLGLSFLIDSRGLELRGACGPTGSAAILVARYGVLLREPEPTRQPIPVTAWMQALAPTAEAHVPATRETRWLLSRLPDFPSAVPGAAGREPRSPAGNATRPGP